jgi:hypothetical protein
MPLLLLPLVLSCSSQPECTCTYPGADAGCRIRLPDLPAAADASGPADAISPDATAWDAAAEDAAAIHPDAGAGGEPRASEDSPGAPDVASGEMPSQDAAACPVGSACNPFAIPALPFQDERDPSTFPGSVFPAYAPCAPNVNESGPEFLYVLYLEEAALLHARLDDVNGDDVDMDVHILSAPSADACVARDNIEVIAWLEPGQYWIAVDTWVDDAGVAYPGPYVLDVFVTLGSTLPDQEGFNKWVVASINDWTLFPKDGTYPYCFADESCEPDVPIYFGMVHDQWYMGQYLFEGTQRCYCCGHTLEVFLDAYRRYQEAGGVPVTQGFGNLTVEDMDLGAFYQHWYGWGVADTSSSANALEYSGIGMEIPPDSWDSALPGDFVNLSRSNGTGHAVIFVEWKKEGGQIVGLRYYGCNGSGDSHPDEGDPDNVSGQSGPTYRTEYFDGYGGKVLPKYVFVGRAFDPATL